MITQKELRIYLNYDSETGIFTWKKRTTHRVKNGDVAGTILNNGYIGISINNTLYFAHRLVFMYVDGYFPEHDVDHLNGNRADNRRSNLREVSRGCNNQNSCIPNTNTSGFKGVGWHKKAKKWTSRIQIHGKTKHLGLYDDKLEAALARIIAEDCIDDWHCDNREENRVNVFKALRGEIDY